MCLICLIVDATDNQMSSVQRQLNLYGFRCVSRGEDKGSFYHAKFHRGDWEQAKLIRRCVSHSQFGLQHWKLPNDVKLFSDEQDKTFSEYQEIDSKTIDQEDNSAVKEMTQSNNIQSQKRNDWAWPPSHVVEQQRSLNTTILKSLNSSDISKSLIDNVSQISSVPVKSQSASLTNRLGFRWNVSTEGSDFLTNAISDSITDVAEYDTTFGIKAYPSDTFEELIEMCQDLDSFLEDCEAATLW